MEYLAHISEDGRRQTVEEHCRAAAQYAAEDLAGVGLFRSAYFSGLIHDMGKAKQEFAEYLEKAASDPKSVRRGSVNHSTAGCRYVLERCHNGAEIDLPELAAELIAYAAGAHHGLFDCINACHESGFDHRIGDESIGYKESLQNFHAGCITEAELETLMQQAIAEMTPILNRIISLPPTDREAEEADEEIYFYLGMLERLLLSAVIDSDRRDTAIFMGKAEFRRFPAGEERRKMWQDSLMYMEKELDGFENKSEIQKARRYISDRCADFGHRTSKVIRLNVPTGSGKTLSSLRFALTYAAEHNSSRIILTSSLLSVLDQNAGVIRDCLPNQNYILEHHSNVVKPENEDLLQWESMVSQWSPPVIITTLVQLLNTLFSGETSCIRRFQALCGSVIVMDEVQTVPNNMLTLFNLALNFLTEVCGATVVLCSATQPCFEKAQHPLLHEPENMVPYEKEIWDVFHRTEIKDAGIYTFDELPDFIASAAEEYDSLLIVCNTKKEAAKLFSLLKLTDTARYHLSASMCMAHRKAELGKIKNDLKEKRRVICVSTQVIEAGVDISFKCVIRFAAGMDSIVQAAGRCNRNGENPGTAPVYVIRCADENLCRLPDIKQSQDAAIGLLDHYAKSPHELDYDLASDKSIAFYYRSFYAKMNEHYQDDVVDGRGYSIFDLMSKNNAFSREDNTKYFMRQAFKTAGDAFSVFSSDTWDVITPYKTENKNGRRIIEELIALSRKEKPDYEKIEKKIEEAKEFSVSIYNYQKEKLEQLGALTELFGGRVLVLANGFYDETGLTIQQDLEV